MDDNQMTEEEWNAKVAKLKAWIIAAPIMAIVAGLVLGFIVGEIL